LQLAYAIGVAHPVSITVETFGTNTVDESIIEEIVAELFDFTPDGILKKFKLKEKPVYRMTSNYGHFGKKAEHFAWEELDMAEELRSRAKT
jgi:S-adenosylmethionine synthetase